MKKLNIKIFNIQPACRPVCRQGRRGRYSIFLFLVLCSLFFIVFSFILVSPALTAEPESLKLLNTAGNVAGYAKATPTSLAATIGKIINATLGLLGVIFLALTVYAGYLWLTAGGDEEKVKKAQAYLYNGLIGMLLILASYGLARFVVNAIINSTMGG